MTVWSTPVPPFLQGQTTDAPGPDALGDPLATSHQPGEDVLAREGGRAPSVRRHSLGGIPSHAKVEEAQVSRGMQRFTAPCRARGDPPLGCSERAMRAMGTVYPWRVHVRS
jgi:hypothetical protein